MSKKKRRNHAPAIVALEARLAELKIRLEHAKYAKDNDKIESISNKMSWAMQHLTKLRKKTNRSLRPKKS